VKLTATMRSREWAICADSADEICPPEIRSLGIYDVHPVFGWRVFGSLGDLNDSRSRRHAEYVRLARVVVALGGRIDDANILREVRP